MLSTILITRNMEISLMRLVAGVAPRVAVCLPLAVYVSLRGEGDEIWGICTKKSGSLGARLSELRQKVFDSALNLIA